MWSWLKQLPRRYWPQWLKDRNPAKTIEIKIWHRDRLKAANVIRDYADRTFLDAWGDRYEIQTTIRSRSIPDMSDDQTFGYVRDHEEAAKDVNAICLPTTDAVGGGSTCKFSVDTPWKDDPDVGDLWVQPNTGQAPMFTKRYACGKPYNKISSALHEMGHCVGLGHNIGGEIEHNGQRYATPMPYSKLNCYYLRYSDEAANYNIDVI